MEIADNQFQTILDMINRVPASNPVRILKGLDAFFYSHIAAWYDSEMSHYFLSDIADTYSPGDNIVQILQAFIENGDDIASKAVERKDVLFFSQPEIVVILERLENRRFMLIDYWERKYPLDQLEAIANAWGASLD